MNTLKNRLISNLQLSLSVTHGHAGMSPLCSRRGVWVVSVAMEPILYQSESGDNSKTWIQCCCLHRSLSHYYFQDKERSRAHQPARWRSEEKRLKWLSLGSKHHPPVMKCLAGKIMIGPHACMTSCLGAGQTSSVGIKTTSNFYWFQKAKSQQYSQGVLDVNREEADSTLI